MSTSYNYEKLMKALEWASYPAGLGAINLILYQYMNDIKTTFFGIKPQFYFLLASFLFFIMSIFVGFYGLNIAIENLSVQEDLKKSRNRTSILVAITFMLALFSDLLGLMMLATLYFKI